MDVINKLKQTPETLFTLTQSLDREALNYRPNGKWSIIIHVGHLLTMESLWIARLDDFFLDREPLRPWNGHNRDTEDGQFELQNIDQILIDFKQLRVAHLSMLEKHYNSLKEKSSYLEAENKRLSFDEHLNIMLEHDEKHLAIIQMRLA